MNHLKRQMNVDKNSRVIMLNKFLDEKDILRDGCRLRHLSIPYEPKYRAILTKRNAFVKIIIVYERKRHLQSGSSLTVFTIWRS